MKAISQWIEDIEAKFPVQNIKSKGVSLWPFYKVFLFDQLYVPGGTLVQHSLAEKLSFVKQSFFGINNYFDSSFTDIAFSTSEQRKEVDGLFPDKLIDGITKQLPVEAKLGHFELPVTPHRPLKEIPNKHTASKLPLRIIESFYSKLGNELKLEGEDIVHEIQSLTNTTISLSYVAQRFWSQHAAMKLFLKKKKAVKRIWIVASYMNYGAIYAAKEREILVIELQHGTVSKEHFGYYHTQDWNISYYPDYLLTFGENEQTFFERNSSFTLKSNIFPVGHFYIESIYQSYLQKLESINGILITVSLQDDEIGEKIVPFLIEVAQQAPDFEIIFSPRRKTESYYRENFQLPENIVFRPKWNVYQAIVRSSVHTTVYSTCAIEAPSLGTPNVLVNIQNRATDYFSEILNESNHTWYANSAAEYVEMIRKVSGQKNNLVETIHQSNDRNIKSSYFDNVTDFLKVVSKRSK